MYICSATLFYVYFYKSCSTSSHFPSARQRYCRCLPLPSGRFGRRPTGCRAGGRAASLSTTTDADQSARSSSSRSSLLSAARLTATAAGNRGGSKERRKKEATPFLFSSSSNGYSNDDADFENDAILDGPRIDRFFKQDNQETCKLWRRPLGSCSCTPYAIVL
jgi:hypothetical protein